MHQIAPLKILFSRENDPGPCFAPRIYFYVFKNNPPPRHEILDTPLRLAHNGGDRKSIKVSAFYFWGAKTGWRDSLVKFSKPNLSIVW